MKPTKSLGVTKSKLNSRQENRPWKGEKQNTRVSFRLTSFCKILHGSIMVRNERHPVAEVAAAAEGEDVAEVAAKAVEEAGEINDEDNSSLHSSNSTKFIRLFCTS
mmetsp:Transcript_14836/g.26658  ORF Transcript_14836/g.26658 Transcript_14836/m.26658 type:complete len:106 (-) Transcript_14836:20-337(-)